MGVETRGMTKVQAAEAALEAAIRLFKDVNIPENFTSVEDYTKNRMDTGIYKGKGRPRATTRTSSGSPSTSWATPVRRATRRSARSRT